MEISQKIIDYAIGYYLRYYPSRKKLSEKLTLKFGELSENGKRYGGIGKKEIDYIIHEKLRNIIQEKEILRSKIKQYQTKGKNISYIKTNLLKKGFLLSDIQEILHEDFHIYDVSFLDKQTLRKKIQNYKNQGKSKNYLKQKFIERSLDREIVEEIIDEVFFEGERENLVMQYQKIKDRFDKQKIKEKLLRKGFTYDDIQQVVE